MTRCLLGLGCRTASATVALGWLGQPRVALCLLGGIFGGVLVSALFGLLVPAVLHRLGKQPHVAAGPIALAGGDLISLLFYLNLARWILT